MTKQEFIKKYIGVYPDVRSKNPVWKTWNELENSMDKDLDEVLKHLLLCKSQNVVDAKYCDCGAKAWGVGGTCVRCEKPIKIN